MLTQLRAAITGYLLLILQVSFAMLEITERRYTAEGSSILMHAPDIKNISFIQWEYLSPTSSALILQHYADSQSLTIYPAYQGRVTFYQKNGSILLQGLEETDSGTYKATVDLMQDKARTTLLKVIKPVPQPELQCTSNLAGSPIELVCLVPEGVEVFSISWKKDGRPLPAEKCYLLSENITVLWIRNGEKSDCGTYSCNISNMISWKEATLNLMVTGLTPPLHHAQRLVIVALMFTTVSAISFIIQLFHRFEEARKPVILFAHGFLCISSLLLLAASIIWMLEEGHKVSQNSTAPTTLIVNLLFTTLLLHNVQKLHERGCSEAVHLTASCGFAAVAIFIMLLLLLLWYHRNKPKEKTTNITRFTWSTQDTTSPVLEETRGQKQEEE
ncbi:hepatocyte cell adhesion molecule-like isoform X5 [Cuculus canorus]|uniref:hepatocyte cell adhesion molecule-like isoform X5 n=1 Tax=Cuculus canorus TaxID=55661 RepID=UPI0023AA3989|nr:hepatocyte cell adhesion molecule-like isoform X5 [Cuculus canorus]